MHIKKKFHNPPKGHDWPKTKVSHTVLLADPFFHYQEHTIAYAVNTLFAIFINSGSYFLM